MGSNNKSLHLNSRKLKNEASDPLCRSVLTMIKVGEQLPRDSSLLTGIELRLSDLVDSAFIH